MDEGGNRAGGGDFHLLVDFLCAHVQRTAEDAREGEEVVDLIREVRASRADDACACCLCLVGQDLGDGVRHRHDDGVLAHALDHLGGEAAGGGDADEDVLALDDLGEGALLFLMVGDFGDALLVRVHVLFASLVDRARRVAEDDGLDAVGEEEACDRLSCRTCAVDDDVRRLEVTSEVLVRVEEGGDDDDRCAVLVIMENGDVEGLFELVLDVKALRCLDVLEVDAAVGGGDELADFDDVLDFFAVHADGDGVDTGKALEEDRLALHDGEACACADVAETEDGGAVRDDGDHVALARVVVDLFGICLDREARCGDAGRVGAAEVVAGLQRDGRRDAELAVMALMKVE